MPVIGQPANPAAARPVHEVVLEVDDGVQVRAVRDVPHHPSAGFATASDALDWRREQLWFDAAFDPKRPAAGAAAVNTGADGWRLLELDSSLRVARGGLNESVAGWSMVRGTVPGAVLDGLGLQVPERHGSLAIPGALVEPRAVEVAPPNLTKPLSRMEQVLTGRNLVLAGAAAVALAGAAYLQFGRD